MRNSGETLNDEMKRVSSGLLSTYEFWSEKTAVKDKYQDQLQTCFRLALELGILIGTSKRLGTYEKK